MAEALKYVKPKNSLKRNEKTHSIKQAILNEIHNKFDLSKLRTNGIIDNQLILHICLLLEQSIKKKYGVNKKEFAVEVVNAIFNGALTLAEINQVNCQIQFAHDNELIKSVEFSHRAKATISDWVCRKFL